MPQKSSGWPSRPASRACSCTLTTSSIADPNLTLTHESLKIFTSFYVLTVIGILVELARELGVGYVKDRQARHARRHHKEDPPETQSAG